MAEHQPTRRRSGGAAGVAIGGGIAMGTASADDEEPWIFRADLTGEAEPHDVETDACGRVTCTVYPKFEDIHYTIEVEDLCDVTEAHVHLGGEGEEGSVVAWIHPEVGKEPEPVEGRVDGTLADDFITIDDLVGPLEGTHEMELVRKFFDEAAYVNVHTEEYPDGEIRGQVRPDEGTPEDARETLEGYEGDAATETEGEAADSDEESGESQEADGSEGETSADERGAIERADEGPELALGELYIGAGTTGTEYIELVNVGAEPIDFTGWTLEDRPGEGVVNGGEEPWPFPEGLVLAPEDVLTVYTNEGETSIEDLDWYLDLGEHRDVWRQDADDTVVVRDADGTVAFEGEYDTGDVTGADGMDSTRNLFDGVHVPFA